MLTKKQKRKNMSNPQKTQFCSGRSVIISDFLPSAKPDILFCLIIRALSPYSVSCICTGRSGRDNPRWAPSLLRRRRSPPPSTCPCTSRPARLAQLPLLLNPLPATLHRVLEIHPWRIPTLRNRPDRRGWPYPPGSPHCNVRPVQVR